MRLPHAAHTDWVSAKVLSSGKDVDLDKDGSDALLQVSGGSLYGPMSVVKVTFRNKLNIDKPHPGSEARVLLEKAAEKFYNYNGEGCGAPKTVYKVRWAVARGCASLIFHAKGEGDVALVANGMSRKIVMKDGAKEEVVIGSNDA